MVSTKIRRLQRMYDNSLDENLSLSAGLFGRVERKKKFSVAAFILHELFFAGASLISWALLLDELGIYSFSPFIHSLVQNDDLAGPMLSIYLLAFPLSLILVIVERFIPVKAKGSLGSCQGNSQKEKLERLEDNLHKIKKTVDDSPFVSDDYFNIYGYIVAVVYGLYFLISIIVDWSGEIVTNAIGLVVGVAFLWFIGFVYAAAWYFFNRVIWFGGSYGEKQISRVLSTYVDYAEQIQLDAMSPSERHSYIQKKQQAEKEERERRAERIRSAQWETQWEKDHKTPVVVDLDRVAAQAQAIYAASLGEYHLTTEDHEILDSIKSMRDTYGDDWTKDM